jgi:hypothetical protein
MIRKLNMDLHTVHNAKCTIEQTRYVDTLGVNAVKYEI